jgi:hypothetical protein
MGKGSWGVGRGPAGGQMRQTNPTGPGRGCRVRSSKCQVGKVPPCRPLTSSSKLQTSHAPRGNRAKRSQTWEGWDIWAKPVAMLGVSRPGSETCKTNPISPPVGRRHRRVNAQNEPNFGRSRARAGAKCAERTQFGPAGDMWRRKSCKTKPNLGRLGYVGRDSCHVERGSAGE